MRNTAKSKLHMVKTDWDEIEKKIYEHRMKRLKVIAIIVGICLAAGIFYYVYVQHKFYTDYTIVSQTERTDTAATHFLEFGGNILKYSNDGASYTDMENRLIWNQTFEMQNPLVSVSGSYVAFADRGGKEIFVLDTEGLQGRISVNMPISKMETASQGIVAVLMEEDGISYLALYNRNGDQIAEGAIHIETGGVPLDIALSPDGKSLGVSILGVSSGKTGSTVNFYDFGSAGQNKVDHIVGTFSYEDTVIPNIAYVDDNRMLAFADHSVYVFSGNEPEETARTEISGEASGIFYDDSYYGLVFSDGEDGSRRTIKIYSTGGKEVQTIQTDTSFSDIRFLDNHEICLLNEREAVIYTLGGRKKFQYGFEKNIYGIIHTGGFRQYTFIMEERTEQARLKLFGGAGEEK